MTNREWLESLSDEELANFIFMEGCKCETCEYDGNKGNKCLEPCSCIDGKTKWLGATHKEQDND